MKVQVVFVLSSLALVSFVSSSMNGEQFYCGRRLAMSLALLCPDQDMDKRSHNTISLPWHPLEKTQQEVEANWPWIVKSRALEGARGKRQGVVAECCDKPCSLPELLSYC